MMHLLYKRLIRPVQFRLWLRLLYSAGQQPPHSAPYRVWLALTPRFDEDEL